MEFGSSVALSSHDLKYTMYTSRRGDLKTSMQAATVFSYDGDYELVYRKSKYTLLP